MDCVWDVYDTDEYNSDNNTGFDVSVGTNYGTIINKYHVLKNFKNRFCCGSKKTMNKDIKLCLLLVPLIFIILLFVPVMIEGIVLNAYTQGMPDVIWHIFVGMLLGPAFLIWIILFYHIPIGVYIAILTVYTVISWTWILKRKKGNAMYFMVWLVLCVLSILMYWKWGPEYHAMVWI